jgi:hypothetical protein
LLTLIAGLCKHCLAVFRLFFEIVFACCREVGRFPSIDAEFVQNRLTRLCERSNSHFDVSSHSLRR